MPRKPTVHESMLAAEYLCRRYDVELVKSSDPRREAVLYAMAAAHKITGTGWSIDHARQNVSVTLPGAGVGADLVKLIPYIGSFLGSITDTLRRPSIFLSPAAESDGTTLIAEISHELGHVGSIRKNGFMWCIAYGILEDVRAGAEAPCYGAGIAITHAFEGTNPRVLAENAKRSLDGYGLDVIGKDLASGIFDSTCATVEVGGDPGGVVADAFEALKAVGYVP